MPKYKVLQQLEGVDAQVGDIVELAEEVFNPEFLEPVLESEGENTPAGVVPSDVPTSSEDTQPVAESKPQEDSQPEPAKSWVGNHKI